MFMDIIFVSHIHRRLAPVYNKGVFALVVDKQRQIAKQEKEPLPRRTVLSLIKPPS
jgi:hypothetical protein